MNTMIFWNRVRSCIKETRTTQQETARICKIPFSTFANWMYRGINPPLMDANRIARHLGVSLEYLIYGKGKDEISKTKEEMLVLLKEVEKKLTKIRR